MLLPLRPTSLPSGILIHSTIWPQQMGQKLGVLWTFGEGELGPHLAQCDLGWDLSPCQVAAWSIQPFGHNRYGPKIRGQHALLKDGELGPHVTQCSLGWDLPPYQVASGSIQPFGHHRHGPKIGGSAPFEGSELGPHLIQCGLLARQVSNHLAKEHQHHRQTGQDRHRANCFTNSRPKIATTVTCALGHSCYQTSTKDFTFWVKLFYFWQSHGPDSKAP